MTQCRLGKLAVALDREDRRDRHSRAEVLGRVILNPAHEARRLISEADAEKSVNCEGCITEPGVAVIPVAGASDDFGEASGGCGNNCSRRVERKELQYQCRSLHLLTPATAIGAGRDPLVPEFHSALKQLLGLFFGGRRKDAAVDGVTPQNEDLRFAFLEYELGGHATLFVLPERHGCRKGEAQAA